ncbi:MAG: LysM peptidoglycan-binding domain-containing protein, partial [Rhodoglobus sp.]
MIFVITHTFSGRESDYAMTHFTTDDTDSVAHTVFAGLVPAEATDIEDRARRAAQQRARLSRGLMNTVPVILVGSLAAVTLNLTGPVEPVNAKAGNEPRLSTERASAPTAAKVAAVPTVLAATVISPAPASYRVAEGDTVSDIASRYGLSTASVLALNGLSWSSLIFPGQQLTLTKGSIAPLPSVSETKTTNGEYSIVSGDTISAIAAKFGVSTISVMSANGLGWSSIIYPGQTLLIPGNLSAPADPTPADDASAGTQSPTAPQDSSNGTGNSNGRASDPTTGTTPDAAAPSTEPVIAPPTEPAPVAAVPAPA